MGAGGSKPTTEPPQYIFAADAPVRFSNDLVESLQTSPESDNTRRQNIELQIQSRVTAELEKLQAAEAARLAELTDLIGTEPEKPAEPSLTEKIGDALSTQATLDEKEKKQNMSRESVSKEIAEMKRRLETRRRLEQADEGVEQAKLQVIQCLRLNDRKPLDCWKEVEAFKAEVGRLERQFLEKTMR